MTIRKIAVFGGLLLAFAVTVANAQTETRNLAPGVTFTQQIVAGSAPLVINVIVADLKVPSVQISCQIANDKFDLNAPSSGLERVASIAKRSHAVAAVNADFFPYRCDPVGLAIRDGELLSEPLDYRVCLGLTRSGVLIDVLASNGVATFADGSNVALTAINRIPAAGETGVFTSAFAGAPRAVRAMTLVTLRGVTDKLRISRDIDGTIDSVADVVADSPLPAVAAGQILLAGCGPAGDPLRARCRVGDKLKIRVDLVANDTPPDRGRYPSRSGRFTREAIVPIWTDVTQAVGGGPWLVRDGKVAIDGEAEGFPLAGFVNSRHARTAVGVTADGKLMLVTVDRSAPLSVGATLPEMAALLVKLGAVNAINLDGGGSTTMAVNGGVVNCPSDGRGRPVADALLIEDARNRDTLSVLTVDTNETVVTAGSTLSIPLLDESGRQRTDAIWSDTDGIGFISQRGEFHGVKVGRTIVNAEYGQTTRAIPIRVIAGLPVLVKASFSAADNAAPDRSVLNITVLDAFGNAVADQRPTVRVTGGEIESPLVTGANGQASAEIVWDVGSAPGEVTVSLAGAPPVTTRR